MTAPMTQAEKTEAVIAMIDRTATELGETEAPLIAHVRELARKLDEVKQWAWDTEAGNHGKVGEYGEYAAVCAILDRP